ncbi:hypothetical protein [Modestobacter roseus]|uniref:hypothetical protein n=1 Tax=Modestobacter roseus TaxID=1181884 RepID=UPI0034E0071F
MRNDEHLHAMVTRAGLLVVTLALTTSGCSGVMGGNAAASCVGPLVSISQPTAAPGETVTVSGEWLRSGCDDGSGEVERPWTDAAVLFLQADRSIELTRVDATGDRSTATVDVTIPVDALPGGAAVAIADTDGPCPPAEALTVSAPGPPAAPLSGPGSLCGRWPSGPID